LKTALQQASPVDSYFATIVQPKSHPNFFLDIVRSDESLTVGGDDFARQCRHLAAAIQATGVENRDVVLIFMSHCADLLPVFFAVQWAGAIPSFMPPLSPRQDLASYLETHAELLAHIKPALVIADPDVAATLKCPADTTITTPAQLLCDGHAELTAPPAIDWSDVALLQHSSGTTGLKKGVALSYRAVLAQIESYRAALQIAGPESVVTWLPVYHDMGLIAGSVMPFVLGLPIVSMDPFEWLVEPTMLLEKAARSRDPLIWLPNFAFHHLARHAQRLPAGIRLDNVRAFINCSEPCRPSTFDLFQEAFGPHGVGPAQLLTCYAMAENVFAVTQSPPGRPVARAKTPRATAGPGETLSCGRPIPGVQVEIRGPAGDVLAEGVAGEVHVRGTSLFEGYFRQPALTAERLRNGWYGTGDIGFLQDGELHVCGRMEDLIIVAGRNLYAHDIEACIASIGGVRPGRGVAFGVDNETSGTEDLVVLVEAASPLADRERIKRDIRERLASRLLIMPAVVSVLDADTLVKTTSGKISRDENRRRYLDESLRVWGRNGR
jgi:acyl-CoA synthetase (AMP-forming)/AMP-acid ligase II